MMKTSGTVVVIIRGTTWCPSTLITNETVIN